MNKAVLERSDSHLESINLLSFLEVVWQRKLSVALSVGMCLIVACAYLSLTPSMYEARTSVLPPASNGIAAFNAGRSEEEGVVPFTVDDVYGIFLRNLHSEALRQRFFEELYLPSLSAEQRAGSRTALYSKFMRSISVVATDPVARGQSLAPLGRNSVRFLHTNAPQAAHWLQTYIDWIEEASKTEMILNVSSENQVLARNIELQIAGLRESAQLNRRDLLARLNEALRIAENIGLENPPIITAGGPSRISADMNGSLVYMRGAKALRAEIDNLKVRTSDDPFIPNLRALQARAEYLNAIQIDPATVRVYIGDGAVEAPERPVKPQKVLIVCLALILGAVIGVLIASIQHLGRMRRSRSLFK